MNYILHVNRANIVSGSNYYVGYTETDNGFVCTVKSVAALANVAYARLSIYNTGFGNYPMIAVDEEIKYTFAGFLADSIKVKGENVIGLAGVGLSVEGDFLPIGNGSVATGGTGAEVFNDYETPSTSYEMTYTWEQYSVGITGYSIDYDDGFKEYDVSYTDDFYETLAVVDGELVGQDKIEWSSGMWQGTTYENTYTEISGKWYFVTGVEVENSYDGVASCYAVVSEGSQNTYIQDVTSTSANAYPQDGTKDGYYYVYKSATVSSTTVDTIEKGNSATGEYSTARGSKNIVTGRCAFASGENLRVVGDWQNGFGRYNVQAAGPTSATDTTGSLFMVGNGTSSTRANAFRITTAGNVYGVGAFKTTGADYAEMWEIEDGNPNNEDWRGYFVTVNEDNKIRKATPDDDYILGITSATPIVLGDVYPDMWQGAYLTDEFGERLVETVEVEESVDENGKVIPAHIEKRWVMNPEYDSTKEYISREDRPEWVAVGLLGKLVVRQDGSCVAGGYCAVAEDGKATFDTMGYKVLKVIDSEHVQVLFR